jgi:hypothetical protein
LPLRRRTYSATTPECLERLGLTLGDLEPFAGLEMERGNELAQQLGLKIFEAVVDGEPRFRILSVQCNWLSVEVRSGTIVRVLGLG